LVCANLSSYILQEEIAGVDIEVSVGMYSREYPKLGLVGCPYPGCKSALFPEEIIVYLI
jgi:hypothetical protein